jgi:hypothetical protein
MLSLQKPVAVASDVMQALQGCLEIHVHWSNRNRNILPQMRVYGRRVQEMLQPTVDE